jgi:putative oxidoreductase
LLKIPSVNVLGTRWREPFARAIPVLLWIIATAIACDFIHQGWRKFDPQGWWAPAFKKWGYPTWFMITIGVIEVTGGLLLIFPKVRHIGAAMLIVIMVGALITRSIHGVSFEEILFFISTISILMLTIGLGFKPKVNH